MLKTEFTHEPLYSSEGVLKGIFIRATCYLPPGRFELLSPASILFSLGGAVVRGVVNLDDDALVEQHEVGEVSQPTEKKEGELCTIGYPQGSNCWF